MHHLYSSNSALALPHNFREIAGTFFYQVCNLVLLLNEEFEQFLKTTFYLSASESNETDMICH